MERTLAIIKPDAVEASHVGGILLLAEDSGFRIVNLKKLHFSLAVAQSFYWAHVEKTFFSTSH